MRNITVIDKATIGDLFLAQADIKLKEKRLINPSGYYRNLPLKVLGEGEELPSNLTFEVGAVSAGAQAKVEAKGGTVNILPGKPKWTRAVPAR